MPVKQPDRTFQNQLSAKCAKAAWPLAGCAQPLPSHSPAGTHLRPQSHTCSQELHSLQGGLFSFPCLTPHPSRPDPRGPDSLLYQAPGALTPTTRSGHLSHSTDPQRAHLHACLLYHTANPSREHWARSIGALPRSRKPAHMPFGKHIPAEVN